jgi:hypothetical protein
MHREAGLGRREERRGRTETRQILLAAWASQAQLPLASECPERL